MINNFNYIAMSLLQCSVTFTGVTPGSEDHGGQNSYLLVQVVFQIPQGFLYTRSCPLQMKMVSCFLLQFGCLYYFCLIALARTSNTVLNRSGESRHPCFVSYLSGKVLSLFTVKYDLMGFPWMPFQRLRKFPSTRMLIVFHMKIHCILSNSYSTSVDTIM